VSADEEGARLEAIAATIAPVPGGALPKRSEGGRIASQLSRFQVGLRLARLRQRRPQQADADRSRRQHEQAKRQGFTEREDVRCQTDEDKEFDRPRAGA
jgi:hypothetical protein